MGHIACGPLQGLVDGDGLERTNFVLETHRALIDFEGEDGAIHGSISLSDVLVPDIAVSGDGNGGLMNVMLAKLIDQASVAESTNH